jgi:hypothetical protein
MGRFIAVVAALEGAAACSLNLDYLLSGQGGSDGGADTSNEPLPEASTDTLPEAGQGDEGPDSTSGTDGGSGDDGPTDSSAQDALDSESPCDAGSPAGNIVANWSFECGVSPWTTLGNGILTTTTSVAHSGTHSGLVTGRVQNFNGPLQIIAGAATPGTAYVLDAWAMIAVPVPDASDADTATQTVKVTAAWQCLGDESESYLQVANPLTATPGTWVHLQGGFTSPTCTTYTAQLGFYIEGPDPGIDLYVDDVAIYP